MKTFLKMLWTFTVTCIIWSTVEEKNHGLLPAHPIHPRPFPAPCTYASTPYHHTPPPKPHPPPTPDYKISNPSRRKFGIFEKKTEDLGLQMIVALESFVAIMAPVFPAIAVDEHMLLQRRIILKRFSAFVANVPKQRQSLHAPTTSRQSLQLTIQA